LYRFNYKLLQTNTPEQQEEVLNSAPLLASKEIAVRNASRSQELADTRERDIWLFL